MDKKKIVDQGIDYIMQHLNDETLSPGAIAAAINVPEYDFIRMFKEETGERIYSFVMRCRSGQSAGDRKQQPDRTSTNTNTGIGLTYGDGSFDYSKLRKKRNTLLPNPYRRAMTRIRRTELVVPQLVAQFRKESEDVARVFIRELNCYFVIYERFVGDYREIEKNWDQFLNKYEAFINDRTILIERFFNDPAIVKSSQCICDLCMTTTQDCGLDNVMWIDADDQWLISHFRGDMQDVFETINGIYNVWLPKSGFKMIQRYGLIFYHDIDYNHRRIAMDVCIPIE